MRGARKKFKVKNEEHYHQPEIDVYNPSLEAVRFLSKHKATIKELEKCVRLSTKEIEGLFTILNRQRLQNNKKASAPFSKTDVLSILSDTLGLTDEYLVNRILMCIPKFWGDARISEVNLVKTISLYVRGTLEEKIGYCFCIYDIYNNGLIGGEEMMYLMRNFFLANESGEIDCLADVIEILMKKFDIDRDRKISFDDYKQTVLRQPALLEFLGPCIPTEDTVHKLLCTLSETVSDHYVLYLE